MLSYDLLPNRLIKSFVCINGRNGGALKPEYFEKRGGNLGGNGNSMIMKGARWERYHQTKLANAVFTKALANRLDGTGIKAIVAAPGIAATNLQVTTNERGGKLVELVDISSFVTFDNIV